MNKKDECVVFRDLYELYVDDELEVDSKEWMMRHEQACSECVIGLDKNESESFHQADKEKIWGIRIMMTLMYALFILLSIWMSVWYFW
ncbi:zf-HC2 domain-containing protein [Bacillus sp. FJAT-45037]|uniref:zf-HC2 domain-containing protein n=1 Tax=Bacillus sp. FJAT-45037 TaxID=2011007 RepID=UPI000C24189C|nr:zf-HC2 domain-containing protein [Bacillus sp. FJAT-45037]